MVFGGFDQWVTKNLQTGVTSNYELMIGFPPIIAMLAIAGMVWACTGRRSQRPMLIRAIAYATVLSLICVVHLGRYSLWHVVFTVVPGASGVRVIARYVLLLTFPVTLLAISFLQSRVGRWPTSVLAILAALLIGEEITANHEIIHLDRRAEVGRLATIPPPPAACRAFFVQVASDRPNTGDPVTDDLYLSNVDAMMLAEAFALPTINGFSTFNPPDWNLAGVGGSFIPAPGRALLELSTLLAAVCAGSIWSSHRWAVEPALTNRPARTWLACRPWCR